MSKKSVIWKVILIALSITTMAQTSSAQPSAAELGEEGIREYEQGNLIDAMALLNQSAEQGYLPAQVRLGYILDQAEENEAAVEWFRSAADANDPAAQLGLAKMYAKGEGLEKNNELAVQWLRRAVAQDYPPAMSIYAYALERGEMGLTPDPAQALHLFQRAGETQDNVAMTRLVRAYRSGELGLAADPEIASNWENKLGAKKP